ncbi:hypothetical protein EPA93_42505 [Ktedonosporobacter rubrisoli]|uniref:Blue (type 1) copper domain-containing protein n=1 Tax=Ktedonosporobacter rubrisoli TaxID=2509675 RepID=A0A4P6K2D4_KTERU|nr:plastocyanin/azurin family copper-binding protein [Ktedonosporobacter rubrisoli]QBD82299.1 hypothetical protein EPA93_42505 [Ktedonosporobacter rubrisoli]
MVNFGQAAVGIILLLIVVGGLLYLFYSRTNAVEKTGYGSLIMLALVSLMIPTFWIMESNNQDTAKVTQFENAVQSGMQLYAQYCVQNCYGIKDNKIVNATYNGYPLEQFKAMTDADVQRIISAGIYNPAAPPPPNPNLIQKSDQYGGALLSDYVNYLFDFIRSSDPSYLAKNGYPTNLNGFAKLPSYLQSSNQQQYQAAVTYASLGQFGKAVDMTNQKEVTIDMVNPGENGATCESKTACYAAINVKVKVGTVITWVNKTSVGHTVTAIEGQDTSKAAPNVFDSGLTTLIPTNGKFSYTVTKAAYDLNADHSVTYYCRVHPDMLGRLEIVE